MAVAVPLLETGHPGDPVEGVDGAAPPQLAMFRRVLAKVPTRLDRFRQGGTARIVVAMREIFKAPPPTGDAAAASTVLTLPLSCADLPRWANRWNFLVRSSRDSARRVVRAVFSGEKDSSGEFVSPVLATMRRFLLSGDAGHNPFPEVCCLLNYSTISCYTWIVSCFPLEAPFYAMGCTRALS